MPTFSYQIRDARGKKLKGTREAASEKALADMLASEGFLVTQIKSVHAVTPLGAFSLTSPRIKAGDLTMFYFQLGNMFEGGVSLLNALRTTGEQLDNRTLRNTISDLATRVEQGESFSQSLGHHPKIFDGLYRTMVQVGEASGNLGEVLKHVAELNERREDLVHKVKSALAYPIILMIASISVVVFMMVWIVPAFTEIFARTDVPLPLPTRMIYGASLWMKSYWMVLLGGVAVGAALLSYALKLDAFKYQWDKFWLSFPVIGQLISRVEISRWSQSVALMLSSGVPILTTLEITSRVTGNRAFQVALEQAHLSVQEGAALAETLQRGEVFPPDVVQMVATGEQSGSIDKMLYKVAHFYDQLIQRSIKTLTASIEPVFIIFMGVVVGFIMVSILLPIFDLLKLFNSN